MWPTYATVPVDSSEERERHPNQPSASTLNLNSLPEGHSKVPNSESCATPLRSLSLFAKRQTLLETTSRQLLRVSHAPNYPSTHCLPSCPPLLSPSGHLTPPPPPYKPPLPLPYTHLLTSSLTHSLTHFSSLLLMANPVVERFSQFYETWTGKLEDILQQLLQVSNQKTEVVKTEQELQALVSTVTSHLKEYYTSKWAVAHENVLIFFSPPWLNPLENAQLWMTGWKPSTVFRQVESLKKGNVLLMTEEQEKKTEELKMKLKMEEEKVEREMERQQVAMADRRMVQLAKLTSRARSAGGEMDSVAEVAVKEVLAGLERVMKASDCVRLKTLKGVLDLLTPMQSVDFLAANITTQLRFKQWGKKKKDMTGTVLNANLEK
ncbi:hypothetical protein VNO80_28802 [Phaseolus coccineus]|uniref:DOG1 domain-containing protein n=1 Tax=Phaseolus coccineus TaxID=3886 RepID=A0AAN9L9R8_PHACN